MFNNLPGIQVNIVDKGLATTRQPVAHSTLIIGTSAQGLADQPYQVTDRAKAALEFGLSGNLVRAMEEAASYSDNIVLFRMGTKPLVLAGIGVNTLAGSTTPGFSLSFGQRTATAASDYKIWYKAGVVAVYYLQSLVYSNDPAQTVDSGDITITGLVSGNTGLVIGTGASATYAGAITITAAAALAPSVNTPAPTLTSCVTGIGLTGRQTYIAYLNAVALLAGIQVEQLVVPAAILDAPNVAFNLAPKDINDPTFNPDALDWLKTTTDGFGNQTFQWASELTNSNGSVTTAMVAATPAARLAAGFYEVNWGYAIANFCASVSLLSNTCVGFLGTSAPKTYKLVDVRSWIGYLPTFNGAGILTSAGQGLCGNPYSIGTDASHLNPLCKDFANGYRLPGFFQTTEGQYDGTVNVDINQNPIDIGAYVHVVADQAILSNGFATNYVTNLAVYTAGYTSMLDEKSALTNKSLAVKQLPGLLYTPGQLDSLAEANINVLRNKGLNKQPALLHDNTLAASGSDYTELLRVRIKGKVVSILLAIGDPFIGESSLDGLQLTALKTALDAALVELQKRGYISSPNVVISTTEGQTTLGHANLYLTFHPADQLIQLDAFVGLTR